MSQRTKPTQPLPQARAVLAGALDLPPTIPQTEAVDQFFSRFEFILNQSREALRELREIKKALPRNPGKLSATAKLTEADRTFRLIEVPLDSLGLFEILLEALGAKVSADEAFLSERERKLKTLERKRQAAAKAREARGMKRNLEFKQSQTWEAYQNSLRDLSEESREPKPSSEEILPKPSEDLF
jgi:hypothetical protein